MSLIENLPLELLQQICGLVGNVSCLATASKRCHLAAKPTLFSTIRIKYFSARVLRANVDRWMTILENQEAFQLIRCVEIFNDKVRLPLHGVGRGNEPRKWQYVPDGPLFSIQHDEDWQPVARLLRRISGLTEVHYSCSLQIAPCVLAAIEEKPKCRLHDNTFSLRSLLQPPPREIKVNPYEIALATSRNLYSITMPCFSRYDDCGNADFNEDAVRTMVSGLAPTLAKVTIRHEVVGGCLALVQALRERRATWQNTELGPRLTRPVQFNTGTKGSLSSLEVVGYNNGTLDDIRKWTQATDFGKLQTLKLNTKVGLKALEYLTDQVELVSLRSLLIDFVDSPDDDPEWAYDPRDLEFNRSRARAYQDQIDAFAQTLPALRELTVTGFYTDTTVDRILEKQGPTLQSFAMFQNEAFETKPLDQTRFELWNLPVLEELTIVIPRTGGSAQEVTIYERLGARFPTLRQLSLHLDCRDSVAKSQGLFRYDERHIFYDHTESRYDMRHVLGNHAIDHELAVAILRKINSSKPGGAPRLQRLELRLKECGIRSQYPTDLERLCKYLLCRRRVCTREVRDNGPQYVSEEEVPNWYNQVRKDATLDGNVMSAYNAVWPTKPGADWRESWFSLPLEGSKDENEDD